MADYLQLADKIVEVQDLCAVLAPLVRRTAAARAAAGAVDPEAAALLGYARDGVTSSSSLLDLSPDVENLDDEDDEDDAIQADTLVQADEDEDEARWETRRAARLNSGVLRALLRSFERG